MFNTLLLVLAPPDADHEAEIIPGRLGAHRSQLVEMEKEPRITVVQRYHFLIICVIDRIVCFKIDIRIIHESHTGKVTRIMTIDTDLDISRILDAEGVLTHQRSRWLVPCPQSPCEVIQNGMKRWRERAEHAGNKTRVSDPAESS
jgi:hypothetical protein